jgi:putative solute:sodium symporter small subunit
MESPREPTATSERLRAYWRANSRLVTILLIIWFLAAFAHPPFAKALNNVTFLTGFPLGYWLASQGSLVIFVVLIFTYALVMNNVIDPRYGFGEDEEQQ